MAERVRHWLHRQPMSHRPAGLICRALHCTAACYLSPPVAGTAALSRAVRASNSLRAKPFKKILPAGIGFAFCWKAESGQEHPAQSVLDRGQVPAAPSDSDGSVCAQAADVGQWACVGCVEPRRKEVRRREALGDMQYDKESATFTTPDTWSRRKTMMHACTVFFMQ